jgi:hypothetical protein
LEIGNNDNDKDKDKGKNPEFNAQAYKHAISMIESSGGKFLDNPNSSAAGRYHFLYELIKKDPDMKGISKRDFMNNTDLQERIMDKALSGKLAGYTYGVDYASRLKEEFGSDHDVSELTALVHFLGPGNTRKYLRNPNSFVVPGKVNKTAQEYIDNFKKHFDKYKLENAKEGKVTKDIINSDVNSERIQAKVQKDATNIKQPRMPKQIQPVPQVDLKENLLQSLPSSEGLDFIDNEFKQGGQMTGLTGADKLVTLFENGGSHEQNPLGGIPQGTGANGKQNLVEEGETKWNNYIFSNSFSLDGTYTGKDGNSSNVFENGGDLTEPTDPKKKKSVTEKNPITENVFGPIEEDKPLEFTKTEPQYIPGGGLKYVSETFEVPDVREQYMYNNLVTTAPDDKVNFDRAVQDENAQEFLNRYNDPWTREKMKEQTQLSDEDIDNMILKGLNVRKQVGGNTPKSKASFDADTNTLHMGKDHLDETGVETHERVHGSLFDAAQGENLMKILGNPFQQKTRYFMKKHSPETLRYLRKPHEAYGNFAEFREKLGLKPGEQIDEKELNKRIKAKGLDTENFIRVYDDDKVVEALNTIAYQDSKPVSIDEYRLS